MQAYDWSKKRQEQPPAWRSSEGKLRERSPEARREGRDHLTGYDPSDRERARGERPREAARLSGSYADVAAGVSKKKEITLVVSKRRNKTGSAATQDEKRLDGQTARRLNLARGDFRTNSHDRESSALAYRESHRKTPLFLLERFKEMMHTHDQDTIDQAVPFLDREPEQKQLKALREKAEDLRARSGPEQRLALREIDSRKSRLRKDLEEKSVQERRLRLSLEKAVEESRRRAGELELLPWGPAQAAAPALEEPPPEGEDEPRGGDASGPDEAEQAVPDEAPEGAPDAPEQDGGGGDGEEIT